MQRAGQRQLPGTPHSPEDVGVENRGKGRNQRRVHNILPDSAEGGLPVGGGSVYRRGAPARGRRKHDTAQPGRRDASWEETYYHRFDPPQGFAFQRVYTDDHSLDACLAPYLMW